MFRIGIFELALTCGLVILVVIIPLIVVRYSSQTDRRLKNIEKQLDKKSK
jgi:hypothetical protein